jgi:hypothetical protein
MESNTLAYVFPPNRKPTLPIEKYDPHLVTSRKDRDDAWVSISRADIADPSRT